MTFPLSETHLPQGETFGNGPFFTVCSPYEPDGTYPFFVVHRDRSSALFVSGAEPRPYDEDHARVAAFSCNQLFQRLVEVFRQSRESTGWLAQETCSRQADTILNEILGICYLTPGERLPCDPQEEDNPCSHPLVTLPIPSHLMR